MSNKLKPGLAGVFASLTVCLLVGCRTHLSTSVVSQPYLGWPDAVRLASRSTEVVVVPSVSRIAHFSLQGSPNVLQIKESTAGQLQFEDMDKTGKYKDFGGAKLWVAPQKEWKNRWGDWPPRYAWDSAPSRVANSTGGAISLQGQPDAKTGVQFDRRVALSGSVADITVTMTNVSNQPISWAIWTVACVPAEGKVFIPYSQADRIWLLKNGKDASLESCGWQRVGSTLVLQYSPDQNGDKLFSNSAATWIAYARAGQLFLITWKATPGGSPPDGEASTEIFAGKTFVELEHVGPRVTLDPGAAAVAHEQWRVVPIPETKMSPEQLAAWVVKQADQATR